MTAMTVTAMRTLAIRVPEQVAAAYDALQLAEQAAVTRATTTAIAAAAADEAARLRTRLDALEPIAAQAPAAGPPESPPAPEPEGSPPADADLPDSPLERARAIANATGGRTLEEDPQTAAVQIGKALNDPDEATPEPIVITPAAVANAIRNLADEGTPASLSAISRHLELGDFDRRTARGERLIDAVDAAIAADTVRDAGAGRGGGRRYEPVDTDPGPDQEEDRDAGEAAGDEPSEPDDDGAGLSPRVAKSVARAAAAAPVETINPEDAARARRSEVLAELRRTPGSAIDVADRLGRRDDVVLVAGELSWLERAGLATKAFGSYRAVDVELPDDDAAGADR